MAKPNSSAGRYRFEYIKHLRKNILPIAVYLIVFIVLSLVVLYAAFVTIIPLSNNCQSIKNSDYTYVIESQGKQTNYRQNYKLNNLVTLHSGNKRINANTYLYSDNGIYKYDGVIESNEIIISQQIAAKLKVGKGEKIEIDLPIYDEPSQYYVKDIIPYVSDYYKVDENLDFAIALLGYDEKLESQISGKYITFLNDDEYRDFRSSSIEYNQRYDIHNELDDMKSKETLFTILFLFILLAIACIYHICITYTMKREIIKYCKDSFPLKVVKCYYNIDNLIYSTFPFFFIFIFLIVLKMPLTFSFGYIGIVILATLWWLIGGKSFEKAA